MKMDYSAVLILTATDGQILSMIYRTILNNIEILMEMALVILQPLDTMICA